MAILLTYGNTPPARGRVQLGEQVRTAEQAQMIALAHERWARSGERAGGLIYKAIRWSTTSASYVQIGAGNSAWPLSRWCPAVRFTVEHEGGVVRVSWRRTRRAYEPCALAMSCTGQGAGLRR